MKTSLYLLALVLIWQSSASATIVIDEHRVYNPENNSSINAFDGKVSEVNKFNNKYSSAELRKHEKTILNFIQSSDQLFYLRDFDTENFYWQFVEHTYGKNKHHLGINIIVPENVIGEDFYTDLGGGLRMKAERCFNVPYAWVNDGEIFSFIIDKNTNDVVHFTNWRAHQDPDKELPYLAYYSRLEINFRKKSDLKSTQILHFVDDQFRTEVDLDNQQDVLLPKGKTSTLVFYSDGAIKGVMCYNLSEINKNCPLYFETEVMMKEKFGTEKILYAQPQCEDIYEFALLSKKDFQEFTGLDWTSLTSYNETLASVAGQGFGA